MQAKIDEVRAKVASTLQLAEQLFGLKLPELQIRFDLTGRVAGQAGWRRKKNHIKDFEYYVRFNTTMMQNEGWAHIINATVVHELAHFVCYVNPNLGRNHDNGWKRVCKLLGGDGQRCHSEKVIYGKGNTYEYITNQGHEVTVSGRIHNSIQSGNQYTCKNKGKLNNTCKYKLIAVNGNTIDTSQSPKVEVQTPAEVISKPNTTGKPKSELVRIMIAKAKLMNISVDDVIKQVISELGMSKSLAKTYVIGNWNKVGC